MGTVNTAGTAVSWVSGSVFVAGMTGIVIGGVQYRVTSVNSAVSLTVAVSAGAQKGVSFLDPPGGWTYFSGQMSCLQANLPGDLGVNDAGFLAFVADYNHVLQWTGTVWTWGPGELGSGMVVPFEVAPSPATGWASCNGSLVNYLESTGVLSSVILPSTAGSYFRQ
jgi:hypothetical protein